MPVTQDQYTSEFGWVMQPPPGWTPLPVSRGPVVAVHRPVVFSCEQDSDLSLTWMVAAHPMKEDVTSRFLSVTTAEEPADAELMEIAPTIFPVIGKVISCELVRLADGTRAVEVIETYVDEGEKKSGYQLILPLKDAAGSPGMFQRLCFYASAPKFVEAFPAVRAAARSFHYTRLYGWKQPD